MSHLHVRLEERPLGPYTARLEVLEDVLAEEPAVTGHLILRDLYTLRLHIDNAIRSLEERRMIDAVCGPCDVCGNTRMIHPIKHGHPSAEHCPVCRPKIDAIENLAQTGLS